MAPFVVPWRLGCRPAARSFAASAPRGTIAVGGTALAGGEGRILGTLIGALIIAVIQNGMNLVGIESYTQKVVLGLVILAAVLVDRLRRR